MMSPLQNYPDSRSLRAWTKPPENLKKEKPSGYFLYFAPPDNALTKNEEYVPKLTTDFQVACAIDKDCKLECPIRDRNNK